MLEYSNTMLQMETQLAMSGLKAGSFNMKDILNLAPGATDPLSHHHHHHHHHHTKGSISPVTIAPVSDVPSLVTDPATDVMSSIPSADTLHGSLTGSSVVTSPGSASFFDNPSDNPYTRWLQANNVDIQYNCKYMLIRS